MSSLILATALILACHSADDATPPAAAPLPSQPAPDAAEVSASEASTPPATPPATTPTAPPTPWPPPEDRSVDPAVQAAADQVGAGAAADAVAALDAWLAGHPDDADALRWRGTARARLSPPDTEGAEADLRRAVELDGDFVGARIALCDLLIPAKRCPDAMEQLDWMVARYPDLADSWANRAFCRLSTHDWEGGVADVDKACQRGHQRSCDMLPKLKIRLDNERAKATAAAEGGTSADPAAGGGATTP